MSASIARGSRALVLGFSFSATRVRFPPKQQHRSSLLLASSARSASTRSESKSEQQQQQQALALLSEAPTIVLKRSRQSKAFRNGNQLVFTRAIERGNRAPLAALVKVAVVSDASDQKTPDNAKKNTAFSIGWGVYNPESLYKIRILCHRYLQPQLYQSLATMSTSTSTSSVQEAMKTILSHHIRIALQKREALGLFQKNKKTTSNNDSNIHTATNMYRLVNGEGDGLSGLHMDVLNTHIVIQSSAAWCEVYKDLILQTMTEQMPNNYTLVWKSAEGRLVQDGYKKKIQQQQQVEEDHSEAVLVQENGVIFQSYPAAAGQQKTGVYCDQRENRQLLSQYTHQKTVLDLCCFHGGFSLTALVQGGAKSTVGVDSSAAAIQAAQENAKLNHVQDDDDKATFVQADITEYMQQAARDGIYYDVVVLDPPKLAPTVASLDKARRKYHGLNRDAIKLINPETGGILMTCTCSAAMTQKDGGDYFLAMVAGAAQATGRSVTLLKKNGAASCHTLSPVCQPAGAYLTAALFYVHPLE